ncbi:MAG: response regulator, partial [Algicola sp.]|nr:response regulator [Algicola sp.]
MRLQDLTIKNRIGVVFGMVILTQILISGVAIYHLAVTAGQQTNSGALLSIVFTLIVGIFVSITLAILVTRIITNPIKQMTDVANGLADGNLGLALSYQSSGEEGLLANAMRRIIEMINDVAEQADIISSGDYTADIKPRSDKDKLGTALQRMTEILRNVSQVTEALATGDTSFKVKQQGENDLLAVSINNMVDTLDEASRQADIIASGDYNADIKPRSDKDKLGTSLQNMTEILRNVSQVAEGLAASDYSVSFTPRSEKDLLGLALQKMTISLKENAQNTTRALWISTGFTGVNDAARGISDLRTLCTQICQYLANYLQVQIMTFYVVDNDKLHLTGSYAFNKRKSLGDTISFGEGLVGQSALEKQTISITGIPEDYSRINSSIGDSWPRNIVALPLVTDDRVMGVLEFGAFSDISDDKIELLDQLKAPMAIMIRSVFEQSKTQELLEETQRQSEELQSQQEELQASNESLEEQTNQLKVSEEELKAQSEELRASNEELSEKTRSLETQKAEIEAASKALETKSEDLALASKYKSEFLANMSHELRTPLNSFLLLSKGLSQNKKGNLDEEQVEDLRIIYEGGADLLLLINDIMDLSKVEAGKLTIMPETVDLTTTCSNIRDLFNVSAAHKNIEFKVNRAADIPAVIQTDPQRLEQVLKNFLSNAFKFTASGTIELNIHRPRTDTVFYHSKLAVSSALGFSVIDTGIGISPDKQKEIFEAFQQADGSTSRHYGGTGLGLTISRELAKILGGEIILNSVQGQGSTFTLYLPMTYQAQSQPAKNTDVKQQSPANPTVTAQIQTPMAAVESFISDDRNQTKPGDNSLLIIDDDRTFANIMLKLVREQGYKGLVAGDGKSGLYLALEYQPKGVILDLGLPDMDGDDVLAQLKFHLDTRHIPVHVVTARDRSEVNLQNGAIGFLTKPVAEEEINEVIGRLSRIHTTTIKKALIVEDNAASQRAISQLIEHKGIQTHCVASGTEALEKIASDQFDCLILDLGLPD